MENLGLKCSGLTYNKKATVIGCLLQRVPVAAAFIFTVI